MGGELDHGKGAQPAHDASRGHGTPYLEYLTVARHEEHVDWKLHKEGVDEVRRRKDQGVIRGQTLTAKEAAVAGRRISRELEEGGDDQARSIVPKGEGTRRPPQQWTKKMFLQTTPQRGSRKMMGMSRRYFTGRPCSMAGLNFQAFAAATRMRSW